ncbi:hypothetical protein OROHE_018829 [Orobanche hederae]
MKATFDVWNPNLCDARSVGTSRPNNSRPDASRPNASRQNASLSNASRPASPTPESDDGSSGDNGTMPRRNRRGPRRGISLDKYVKKFGKMKIVFNSRERKPIKYEEDFANGIGIAIRTCRELDGVSLWKEVPAETKLILYEHLGQWFVIEDWDNDQRVQDIVDQMLQESYRLLLPKYNNTIILLEKMSDNGSVPSPPMKDSDHLFGPSEIGPKFAYEAGIRRKIISKNDMFPEWAGYIRRLRACELEEGGSLCNHILEMMNYMNKLEYLDTNFDRNLAVPLLLRSLPDSYNDFLWKNHCENKSKTWIEIINELRRYEEDKITQKGKLEKEKGKEKRKEKHYALDAQVGSSKRRKSCSWRDLGNGERKCPKNIEESIGSSS